MKKIALFITLLFASNIFSQTLECRAVDNIKIGMYVEMYDNKIIDPSENIYNKIGEQNGKKFYRGYDRKKEKYYVWIMPDAEIMMGITAYKVVLMEDSNTRNNIRMICFNPNEVKKYR